jgi:hypothetical protein
LSCLKTDIETNECLNDNGGCWQDKSANVTACRVCVDRYNIFIDVYVRIFFLFFHINVIQTFLLRTPSVVECVNAPLSMAYNSKAMATAIVNVMSFVLFSHILTLKYLKI